MSEQPHPQYEFRYQRVVLIKTESLGIGSYGAVCKALCDDLPCAAKILHPTLFQFTAPGTTSVMRKFEQECRLLSAIKHPYIVQYLGTYTDNETGLPVLLMELMDESLTRFLERSDKPLPFHTEVNLCNDIVLALSYLHSNGIVHRDLSSNNVLLIAGSRAKVTDFGMVKLYDINRNAPQLTPLTLCPGTVAYMSPEALRDRPDYTEKLDSFSFGVLCVQIMTRQFPNPGDRFNIIEINDPRAPSGRVQVEVPEIERRRSQIDLIDPAHPLLPVALDCLKDNDQERPSCHELCDCLSTLKALSQYTESVQQSTRSRQSVDREREMQQSQQVQDLQQQLHTLSDQLQEKEHEVQQQQRQILGLENQLTETNDQLRTIQQQLTIKDEQLTDKDHQLLQKELIHQQEIQQLRQFSEHVTLLEKEKTIRDQQRQILELLQQQPRQRGSRRRENVKDSSAVASGGTSIQLKWMDGGRAPCKMWGAVAVMSGGIAFFRPRGYRVQIVTTYNSAINKWSELPKCPNHFFSLAVINSLLTAIGGKRRNHEFTNSLLSLTANKWTERFPPMPTKRWLTTVVCSARTVVVAGGTGEGDKKLSIVEVMDIETLQWSTASNLPHPLFEASATLCGDQIYMLSGFDQIHHQGDEPSRKSVFTCSLTALLQSCQPQFPGEQLKTLSPSGSEIWLKVADTPYYTSTCVSLHGQLLAVGGCNSDGKTSTDIHMYNTTTNSWEVISHLLTPRSQCLIAVLPYNELMVVGGYTPDGKTDTVEIATIN